MAAKGFLREAKRQPEIRCQAQLAANRADLASRTGSTLNRDPAVRARTTAVADAEARRSQPYPERAAAQHAHLGLSPLPTTTIGSFPQTTELRARASQPTRGAHRHRRIRGTHQG